MMAEKAYVIKSIAPSGKPLYWAKNLITQNWHWTLDLNEARLFDEDQKKDFVLPDNGEWADFDEEMGNKS